MKRILTSIIALAATAVTFGAEWYVDPVNGLDTRDGTTSNVVSEAVGPRKTLEKAMELVNAGDTLWLLPGEYNEGSMRDGRTRIYVTKSNVKVKSTAGAANTFIVGEGGTAMTSTSSKNCAQVYQYATGVIFEGVTFKDGCGQRQGTVKDNGGGIRDGTEGKGNTWAVDCVFTNCYAYYGGGMYYGNALRCRFVDCGAESGGGAVARGRNFAFCLFDGCSASGISTFDLYFSSSNKFYNCTFYGNIGNAFNQGSKEHSVLNSIIVGYEKNGTAGMYATNSVIGTALCADAFNCVTDASVADSGLVSPAEGDFRVNESSAAASLGDASRLADFPAPAGYSLDRDLAGNPVPSSGPIPVGCLVETRRPCHLHVDCVNGDDANGGTEANPYKTIRAATEKAVNGDVIHVAPGTYGAAEGSQLTSETAKIGTRVIIPEGVTVESTGGATNTFIVGEAATGNQIDNATYGTGTNAVRCVYAKEGAVLRGFTLTGGRGIGSGVADGNGRGAAFYSQTACGATVEECIISNNVANRATIYQAVVKRCRVIGNAGTSASRASSAGNQCRWYGTIIDSNFGDTVVDGAGAFENCTIGVNNTCNDSRGPVALYWYYLSGTIVNSVILGGRYYVDGGSIYCTNSLVMADRIGSALKRENSYNTIFTNLAAAQVDSEYRPVLGSFVGIDAGDAAYSTEALGDTDIYGTPRILNAALDIGAVEYDWRPTFNAEIGRRFKMTYASPTVTTNATGGVKLDGDVGTLGERALPVCIAGTVTSAGPYEFRFEMTGGSAAVYVGGVLAGETSGTGAQSIRFNVPDAAAEIRFVFTPEAGNPGAAVLRKFAGARGFSMTIR